MPEDKNPATLHIYRGLQGSGKSTMAEAMAVIDGGRLAGRDRIRKLLGVDGLGTSKQEQEVTEHQGRLIMAGLRQGQNVHVDDMNLKVIYVKRLMFLAHRAKAKVKIHDLSWVPLETCLERNWSRVPGNGFVNEDVIRSNWERFIKPTGLTRRLPVPTSTVYDARVCPVEPYVPNPELRDAVLVDLDGTIALKSPDRSIHDYNEKVLGDLPNTNVIRAVQGFKAIGISPVFLSGRKGTSTCREATQMWIQKHVLVGSYDLHMRAPHDNRTDYLVKKDLFDAHVRNTWNVIGALDDRQQVVDMYREMGLTVFQVAPGDF